MPKLEKILTQMDDDWKEAEAVEITGRVSVPDGNYKCILKNARVEFSKSSERLQIAWEMEIAEGKNEGKAVSKFDGLDNDVSMGWVKGTLKVLGIEVPKSLRSLPKTLEEFFEENEDGVPINVTVKTKDEFTNVYINGLAEEVEEGKKGKKSKKETKEKEEEEEEEEKGKSKKGKASIKADDLDDMNLSEMLEAADYLDIAVPKKIREDKKKVRAYLKELI